MAIFSKSTNVSTNNAAELQLKSARTTLKSKIVDENEEGGDKNKTKDSIPPSNFCVDEDTENTGTIFDKLFNCWGAGFSCDGYIQSEMSPSQSQARQAKDDQNQEELKKLEKEKEAAIARRKKKLAALVEKEVAAEKAKKVRDLAQMTADGKMKQQEEAREAANDRQLQAEIEADQAKSVSEMEMKKVIEARRQVKKAKEAMKMAKKEAKRAKKMAKKEAKQAKRAQKEADVMAKKIHAARHKYAKAEAAAARKVAKEERKKADAARKLVLQMEKEENQIRDAEDTIRNLRQKLKAVSANGRQDDDDCDTVLTEASTDIRSSHDEMSNADFQDLLSDMLEEASILLGK